MSWPKSMYHIQFYTFPVWQCVDSNWHFLRTTLQKSATFSVFDGIAVSSPSVLLKNRPCLQLKILIFWNYFILLSYPFTFIACASIYDFISSILYLLNPLHFNFCFWSKSPYLPLFIMSQTILQFCQDLYIVCCLLGFSFSKRGPSSSSSSVFPLHISLYLIHLLLLELHLFTVSCPNYLWILVYFYYLYFLL